MKKAIILILNFVICMLLFQNTRAQTISLSGPSTVTSGDIVTFTAVGESNSKFIGNVPINPYNNFTSPAYNANYISCILSDTYYYDPSKPNIPGKFNYKLINTYSSPITVKLTFHDIVMDLRSSSGIPSSSIEQIIYTIIVNPYVPPVTPPIHYYYHEAAVTSSEYSSIWNADLHGESGSGIGMIGPNILKEVRYTPSEAAVKFGITDGGAVYQLELKGPRIIIPYN